MDVFSIDQNKTQPSDQTDEIQTEITVAVDSAETFRLSPSKLPYKTTHTIILSSIREHNMTMKAHKLNRRLFNDRLNMSPPTNNSEEISNKAAYLTRDKEAIIHKAYVEAGIDINEEELVTIGTLVDSIFDRESEISNDATNDIDLPDEMQLKLANVQPTSGTCTAAATKVFFF